MGFFQTIAENMGKETYQLIDSKYPFDYCKLVIATGIIAVNAIMSKSGCQTVWLKSLLNKPIKHHVENKDHPETLEEFVSMTDELAYLDYTNIMKKFKSVLEDNDIDTVHLAENAAKIGNKELTKIRESLEKDVKSLSCVILELNSDEVNIHTNFPISVFYDNPNQLNDAMHYAKDAIINVIKDSAKDIWDIITGQNQIDLAPKLSNPEVFVIQQLPQPLVAQQSVFTPVPNYSGNKAIMKHFVIGNNVVIYDPNQQQMFEKDLVDLSKALDKVDKELKLKEPSKYGFEQFTNSLNFKAVRLDKDGKYINNSDSDNYIAIWTDKSTLYITKPSKATA